MSPITPGDDLQPLALQVEVVVGERLDVAGRPADVVRADGVLPDLQLAEELRVHQLRFRGDGHDPRLGEGLSDDAGAKVVVGMGVGQVDGRELLAGLDDLGDEFVSGGERPLRVDKDRVGLAHDDDGCDLECLLVTEVHLGG